ncbi:MAG TPA: NAD(P)/FAD-dependent oxidoreductase [Polyangia bacterium]|nr:NAD(P)/FAD-dependent oxidoreductase [Polyangia bacterium]
MADEVFDVVVVGGGPAGSTCARFLTGGGARVAVVDRAEFPRTKLCGGWISTPIWDALSLSTRDYTGGLWEWNTCHVRYGGEARAERCRGWFIRRFELDDFLLRRGGATLRLGLAVKDPARGDDGLWDVAGLRARHLVGAGGTHCPVARVLAPPRPSGPVGAQENEFRADPAAIARTRVGADGEPELLLHDDLRGYSWNVPKTDWLNVGAGTVDPNDVREAWRRARGHFLDAGHLPAESVAELDAVKGHAYYLYDPAHLAGAARVDADGRGGAYLVGDSLGLAQPLTAEGILPAVISGRTLAEAILAGDPASYPARLAGHAVLQDYRRLFRLREATASLLKRRVATTPARSSAASRLGRRAVARGFAWMFSGAPLPAPRLLDLGLAVVDRWRDRQRAPRAAA